MRRVDEYTSLVEAKRSLDNGGRFFNLLTRAGDDVITAAELGKAAGVVGDRRAAFVYLAMASHALASADRSDLMKALDHGARESQRKFEVTELAPGTFGNAAEEGCSYLVEGFPVWASERDSTATVFMPLTVGDVTTMMPTQVTSQFHVYELHANRAQDPTPCLVAIPKQDDKLSFERIRFGGLAKTMTFDGETGDALIYLKPSFYTPLA